MQRVLAGNLYNMSASFGTKQNMCKTVNNLKHLRNNCEKMVKQFQDIQCGLVHAISRLVHGTVKISQIVR